MKDANPANMRFRWDIKDGNYKPEIISVYELLERINGKPLKTALIHAVVNWKPIKTEYAVIERIK